jgi:site-specific recombinase XerD
MSLGYSRLTVPSGWDAQGAALKRVGIPRDRHHMMYVTRHTFASSCLSEGISVRAVAERLGDTEATVQATYSHLMPDDTERVRKAIGRFFAQAADSRREPSIGGDVP